MTPFVSIIVPIRNEEKYIRQCLESLLHQDYPHDMYEILVVDGVSQDASASIVDDIATTHGNVRRLHNPKKYVSAGLNVGIRESRGDIVVRMDAHALASRTYVSKCVKHLLRTGADNVGGIMKPEGRGFWGQSIALATSCPFGVGNSKHRCSLEEGYDEAGWLGAFWKRTLLELGGYNELLVINEDDELNYRLLKRGGKVYRTPEIETVYFCRNSLKALAVQYFRYAYWKLPVIQSYDQLTAVRHIIPSLLVIVIAACLVGGLFLTPALFPLFAIFASHLLVGSLYAIGICRKNGWRFLLSLSLVFLTLHLSYGSGFLAGILKPPLGWRKKQVLPNYLSHD